MLFPSLWLFDLARVEGKARKLVLANIIRSH
jgi:hypothetical protein